MKKDVEKIIKNYKNYINENIVDKDYKTKIIEIIDWFNKEGNIVLIDDVLYGKIKNKKYDVLELRIVNSTIVCNYTEWGHKKYVNITQLVQKDKNTKINFSEKVEYDCKNNENDTSIKETEKLYNCENKLLYMSELSKETNNTYSDQQIKYFNNWYQNIFKLEKTWYINNNSIIKYELSKKQMNEDNKTKEYYSICYKPIIEDFSKTFVFHDLDENLFKEFMTGNITIDHLIEENLKKEECKELKKTIN